MTREYLIDLLNEIPDKESIEGAVFGEKEEGQVSDLAVGELLSRDAVFSIASKVSMYTPIYVWTPDWVCFMYEYDGNVWLSRVPRNPRDIEPEYNGITDDDWCL